MLSYQYALPNVPFEIQFTEHFIREPSHLVFETRQVYMEGLIECVQRLMHRGKWDYPSEIRFCHA